MSSWLEQLERELDARLSAFLRNNPVQEHLFSEQHLKDRAAALQRQRQQLQGEAKQQRQQLLRLAEDVRAWRSRVERCLLYTSPSPRDLSTSRMPSSA